MRIVLLLTITLFGFCNSPGQALGQNGLLGDDPIESALSTLAKTHRDLTTYSFVAKGHVVRQKQEAIRTTETIIIRSVKNGREQMLANAISGGSNVYWMVKLYDQAGVKFKSGNLKNLEEKIVGEDYKYPMKTFDPILQSLSTTANFANSNALPADKFTGILGDERLEDVILGTDENIAIWSNKHSEGNSYFQETVFSKSQKYRPTQTIVSRRQQGKTQVRSRVLTEWGDFNGRYLPQSMSGVYYPINPGDTETQFEFAIDWRFNELRFDPDSYNWIEPIEESFEYLLN